MAAGGGNGRYDAVVVGAGPSGATAAYWLARAGARTLLLEKARLPRYKTCGGGVTHKAARMLPFSIEPVVERTLRTAEFSWRTARPCAVTWRDPLVYMVQRSRFDHLLVEQAACAGAEVRDGVSVTGVEVTGEGATVRAGSERIEASYVVGADGATGRTARSLGLMAERSALAALESEVEVAPGAMERWAGRMGLDLGEVPAGYGWVFPKGEHLSVGVGGLPVVEDYGKRLHEYHRKFTANRVPGGAIRRVIRSHGYLLPIRRPGTPVHRGRGLLVGDAAGLVEAFTGEGIYWAIRSGRIAARAIVDGRHDEYTRRLDLALMPDLLAARRWMRVYVAAPWLCYALPAYVPQFWSAVTRIVRGERRFREVRRMLGPFGLIEPLLADPVEATFRGREV
ncbi:MAG TPA: geranylgeranyl reductase family protein [Chloroflexia bacterium]|nr:geranylgeranyl reductase family protein [Chloroflexia bacterium]